MPTRAPSDVAAASPDLESALLRLVRDTRVDLHGGRSLEVKVTLDSALDRDLGLDSLARVELLARVERAFGVQLPEAALALVETPRDLLRALRVAGTSAAPRFTPDERVAPTVSLTGVPEDATTLLEALDWHVQLHAERVQIVFLSESDEEEISYGRLRSEAAAVAEGLRELALKRGQTVAIMLPTGPGYFFTYLGVLLAGGVPVPIYPPARAAQIADHVRRHARILANAGSTILVTVPEAMPVARLLEATVPGLRRIVTVDHLRGQAGTLVVVPARSDDIAFIQYTSGSTGNPKGVVLTHANLLANIRAIGQAVAIRSDDVFVSWLPLYHDMGLISGWLASLYFGNPLVVMSPLAFLARPERWLWAIHRHRGTLTAAPNFAYELCLKRIEDSALEGLDLGSMRFMANGAEPVSPDTVARFAQRFSKYGLRPNAMAPVYGLAEATVALLCPPPGRGLVVDRIERERFVREGLAIPAPHDDPNPLRFVACGRPLPGHRIRILDEAGNELGERTEGRLEFTGPSATSGYFGNPEQTQRLIRDGWVDTGDRAYAAAGDVYITGRVKDIIIRGGRNIYPHEIEEAVGALAGVRKGCVAAFGSPDPATGTERLVVLAETHEEDAAARGRLRESIVVAATDLLGEPPDEVVLAPPHTVLKTSSGKVRRAGSREIYEAGLVGAPSRRVWWQLGRMAASATFWRARRALAAMLRLAHGTYVRALFWGFAGPDWLLTAMLRDPRHAWKLNHFMARMFLGLAGIPLRVDGAENLPRGRPYVLVANHSSYADGLVLAAALTDPLGFIAKKEFESSPIAGVFLRRLGAEFVERFAVEQSAQDAARLAGAVRAGKSLAFFPEGTFREEPGLLPFHLGAFAAAVQANVPVVPVAIRGTRSLLPGERKMPRPCPIVVTVGSPIEPPPDAGDAFMAAVVLRDAARAEILRHCGEADGA